jgi:uncharacterized BrkB/YihY/UPF0761 family membrane protein
MCAKDGTIWSKSFSIKINERVKGVSDLILLFSVILLFGTFLVGIAQFLVEHQVVVEGVKLLSYKADYLQALIYGGSFIIGGCLVGLFGLLLHILPPYNTSLKNYIINGSLIDAILFILVGTLYFIYMISNPVWPIMVVTIGVIAYYFYYLIIALKPFFHRF